VKRWVIYTATSALLVCLSAVLIGVMVEPPTRSGIWAGLGSAWLVQAAAFGILVAAAGRHAKHVAAGWTLGTVLRLGALGAMAWLSLGGRLGLPAEPTLLALVISLFALLLLEPVVFRYRLGTR